MSKPIDYSKFDHIGDSDSESESGTCDSAAHNSSNEETSSSFQTQQAQAQSTQMSIPITKTTQEQATARYVFSCNGQKVYAWDQNLDEVNVYIPAPPNLPASAFDISIQPQALQVKIRSHDKFFIDEKTFSKASMELVAKDRMREIKMWSKLKIEFDDGTFDTKDVNRHQLESYHEIMKNRVETITAGTSQPEVFNAVGQLKTIERVKKDGELKYDKKEEITFGKQKP